MIKVLRQRWTNEDSMIKLYSDLAYMVQHGGSINNFMKKNPLLENGFFDLRAINLDTKEIKKCKFVLIDFTLASFKRCWIEKSFFNKCVFVDTCFFDISEHSNIFEDCLFERCNFNSAAIGYSGSQFINCTFINCTFKKTIFIRPEFTQVLFAKCLLSHIDFNASSFESCSFEGKIEDVWFHGGFALPSNNKYFGVPRRNTMKEVSFENAELMDLTFSDNCDLSTIKIQSNGEYYKYDNWKNRLIFLKQQISNYDEKIRKNIDLFIGVNLTHADSQEWNIISRHDLKKHYGDVAALKIIDILNLY